MTDPAAAAHDAAAAALDRALRRDRPHLVATLLRAIPDWELAEDCLHDAAEKALSTWPRDGVPENPSAWLSTVARRRAIDVVRRRATQTRVVGELAVAEERRAPVSDDGGGYADDRLRMLFTCCHPDLPVQDRVALTLRSVVGLSTREVADLFLVSEATMSQRLRRTRARITAAGRLLQVPAADDVDNRVDAVILVIQLVFAEAHDSSGGLGVRDELADEALTLAQLLAWLRPHDPEVQALRALVLLQHARRPARIGHDGAFIALDEQDRRRWDRPMVVAGVEALTLARELAEARGEEPGVVRAQAEIAALHSTAPTAEVTDWAAVVVWYDGLLRATESPVVAFNRAIAVGMRDGASAGLAALEQVASHARVRDLPRLPIARADLLRRSGDRVAARAAYADALTDDQPQAVRRHLERRLRELADEPGAAGSSGVVN